MNVYQGVGVRNQKHVVDLSRRMGSATERNESNSPKDCGVSLRCVIDTGGGIW